VLLLILESLGSTELLFILIMALVFFGPRKLPQISRSLGKNLADFRRASEDFKRTWDREANLDGLVDTPSNTGRFELSDQNSIAGNDAAGHPLQTPTVATPDQVIARHAPGSDALQTGLVSDSNDFESVADETKPSPKSDWL
jgi:TatA/E family protein of Tat protein translocase